MGKIYYGYDNKNSLYKKFTEEYQVEYLDTITIRKHHYLITKFKDNIIDVREIVQDVYLDGTVCTYANEKKSEACKLLEEFFNSNEIKNKIELYVPLTYLLEAEEIENSRANIFSINHDNQLTTVILIQDQIFREKRRILLASSDMSFLELAQKNISKIKKRNNN